MPRKKSKTNGSEPELGLVPIYLPTSRIKPSPENIEIYGPVKHDADFDELKRSVKEQGFKSTLVVSADDFILSGHRRHAVAVELGIADLPCFVDKKVTRLDESGRVRPDFLRHLAIYNSQREKSRAEKLRESVIKADPQDSYRALSEFRRQNARLEVSDLVDMRETKTRARISPAKQPFMDAILRVFQRLSDYLPLTVRLVHYELLNHPPLKHASKRKSRYRNDDDSYGSLVELLTRMRFEGIIPFKYLEDSTRPVVITKAFPEVGAFLRHETDQIFKGYYRDLMQSQENHIEIMYEKMTGQSFVQPIAMNYCIPLTVGRGFSSVSPRMGMARRYKESGKSKLIIIAMSDLDPDGDEITASFARSMRDEFGIPPDNVECFKAALKMEQVREFGLPPGLEKAKKKSTNYPRYVEAYGTDDVYELEALGPERQQQLLDQAIRSVIDVDAYNDEVEAETDEAAFLDEKRQTVLLALKEDEE